MGFEQEDFIFNGAVCMDEYFRDENLEDDFGLSSTQLQSSNIMPSVNDKKRKEAANLKEAQIREDLDQTAFF